MNEASVPSDNFINCEHPVWMYTGVYVYVGVDYQW